MAARKAVPAIPDLPDDPALIAREIERHLRAALAEVRALSIELAPAPTLKPAQAHQLELLSAQS